MNLRSPILCTLTGVDQQTDLDALAHLSARFPWAEWGFLYSPSRAGKDSRYPVPAWIEHAIATLNARVASIRVALQACGGGVAELADGWVGDAAQMVYSFAHSAGICGRLQLNLNATQKPDISAARSPWPSAAALAVVSRQSSLRNLPTPQLSK